MQARASTLGRYRARQSGIRRSDDRTRGIVGHARELSRVRAPREGGLARERGWSVAIWEQACGVVDSLARAHRWNKACRVYVRTYVRLNIKSLSGGGAGGEEARVPWIPGESAV